MRNLVGNAFLRRAEKRSVHRHPGGPVMPGSEGSSRFRLGIAVGAALAAAALAAVVAFLSVGGGGATQASAADSPKGDLGQTSGLLPRSKLTLKSALQVDLSRETVRLPL